MLPPNINIKFPCIILVESQLAENIGMTARAMKNCGFSELRLVNPKEDFLSAKALSASSNSEEILQNAQSYSSLADAVADLQYVMSSTARHRDQTKPVFDAPNGVAKIYSYYISGCKSGFIFGPERTGLNNQDISLSDSIINIPLNPAHASLNLSQAVLLICYEFYKIYNGINPEKLEMNRSTPADKEKVLLFCDTLTAKLKNFANFNDINKSERLAVNLRNIFTRNNLTEQELNTLYGITNYLGKH